jgi:hypothetical protein
LSKTENRSEFDIFRKNEERNRKIKKKHKTEKGAALGEGRSQVGSAHVDRYEKKKMGKGYASAGNRR